MDVICRPRRSGKTTDLIKACAEQGGCIVCHDRDECYRVAEVAKKLGVSIPFPISFSEFLNNRYHLAGVKGFHIDSVEKLLRRISAVPVWTAVITVGEREL